MKINELKKKNLIVVRVVSWRFRVYNFIYYSFNEIFRKTSVTKFQKKIKIEKLKFNAISKTKTKN